LVPVQVKILPIADRHVERANEIAKELSKHNIRYEIDSRNEKVNYKIREAEVQKINYMVIFGDKELESNNISLRKKGEGDVGNISLTELVEMINMQVQNKN
jgi:threonyl-tRNA synthetase